MKKEKKCFSPKAQRLRAIVSNLENAKSVKHLTFAEPMIREHEPFKERQVYSGYEIWCPDNMSNNRIIAVIEVLKRNRKSIWYRINYIGYHCVTNNIADNKEIKDDIRSTDLLKWRKANIVTNEYGYEEIYEPTTGLFISTCHPTIHKYWLFEDYSWSM